MLDYKKYRAEQFATDPSFRNWKLHGKHEDARFWTDWVAQHPDKKRDIEKAAILLEAVNESFDQITEAEIRNEIHRLAALLDSGPESISKTEETEPIPLRKRQSWWWQTAAVTIIGLVGLGWWLFRGYQSVPAPLTYSELVGHSQHTLTETVNDGTSIRYITLPDSSTIQLQPGGKLSYQADFSGPKREIYLSGEAFFDVVRNPDRPFFVYTDQLVTKVLGTSFTIKAQPGEDQIQVIVKSGRVSVYTNTVGSENKGNNEVLLTPNQKVVFMAQENQFARSLIESPELLPVVDLKPTFVFKAAPIREVFEKLEKAYGIEIVFDEETMNNCYLTASFTDEPLFEKLDLITRTLNASYQQVDGQIIISSKGC